MTRRLRGVWLGRRRYGPVHAFQERVLAARQRGELFDTVLFVEHEAVVTLGRGAHSENLLASEASLAELGVDLVRTGRGGDVTLHAPGQLVAYPILDLSPERRDVRRYVKDLTETMRRLASELGVEAGTHEKHIGLWADGASPHAYPGDARASELVKVGAIGVRISRWCTMHGFALNLCNDLSLYRVIVPCGIREHGVGSIATLGGTPVDPQTAARRAFEIFGEVFAARLERFDDRAESPLDGIILEGSRPEVRAVAHDS
ncbi:MAG TPA: lipoyl(octanoyl) transferase LipB [Polyangiaceae bacterium]